MEFWFLWNPYQRIHDQPLVTTLSLTIRTLYVVWYIYSPLLPELLLACKHVEERLDISWISWYLHFVLAWFTSRHSRTSTSTFLITEMMMTMKGLVQLFRFFHANALGIYLFLISTSLLLCKLGWNWNKSDWMRPGGCWIIHQTNKVISSSTISF